MSPATTDTASLEAERYLKAVAPHLAVLPAEERSELLEDLAQHLREIAAEEGPALTERLGSPAAYAAELLASAGVAGGGRTRPLAGRAHAVAERARRSWVGQEAVRMWPFLQPTWWVIRGYLAVSLLSALERNGSYPGFPVPRLFGSPALGLLGILVAIPLSVRLGQRRLPRPWGLAVVAANVVLALFALALLARAGTPEIHYVDADSRFDVGTGGCLSTGSGRAITNLYAYGPDGRLIDPVLLYDDTGRPIDNLCPEVDAQGRRLITEYRRDANGAPVINAFPRRQSVSADSQWPLTTPGVPGQPPATVPVAPPQVVVPPLPSTTTTTAAPAG